MVICGPALLLVRGVLYYRGVVGGERGTLELVQRSEDSVAEEQRPHEEKRQ
jgi:hypothetical protein